MLVRTINFVKNEIYWLGSGNLNGEYRTRDYQCIKVYYIVLIFVVDKPTLHIYRKGALYAMTNRVPCMRFARTHILLSLFCLCECHLELKRMPRKGARCKC